MSYSVPEKFQVNTGDLTAFGINISSRHALAFELIEMLSFCKLAAAKNAAQLVESLFYDSNSNSCTITLAPEIEEYSEEEEKILQIAKKTLGQFEWHGGIEHGAPAA